MWMTWALWLHVAVDSWSMDVFSWTETSKLLTACRMWTGNVAIQFFILLDEWKKNQWAYCQLTVCKQFQTLTACRFIQFLSAVVVQQNVYRVVEPSLRNRWLNTPVRLVWCDFEVRCSLTALFFFPLSCAHKFIWSGLRGALQSFSGLLPTER